MFKIIVVLILSGTISTTYVEHPSSTWKIFVTTDDEQVMCHELKQKQHSVAKLGYVSTLCIACYQNSTKVPSYQKYMDVVISPCPYETIRLHVGCGLPDLPNGKFTR